MQEMREQLDSLYMKTQTKKKKEGFYDFLAESDMDDEHVYNKLKSIGSL